MENIWDYVMRRKPVFLGYFALFLVSIFASCQFLSSIIPKSINPGITQESPETPPNEPQYYDRVLSPQAVATLNEGDPAQTSPAETAPSDNSLAFVQVEIINPYQSIDDPTDPSQTIDQPISQPTESTDSASQPELEVQPILPDDQLASTDSPKTTPQQSVEVPLTGAPVSIFRTVLAVLLAITALTLAGFGLYQAYDYFRPFFKPQA